MVDIVDKDAVPFAKAYFPETMTFGRASTGRASYLYRLFGEYTSDLVEQGKYMAGGDVILEVRGDGQYAVFPGSIHESGEAITFGKDWDHAHIRGSGRAEIELAIDMVRIATVLYKRWIRGDRSALALNASKCFLSAGWSQGGVEDLITLVAKAAGDDDIDRYLVDIQRALDVTYKSGRSELVARMGEGSVAEIEVSLANIEEWRDALYLDHPWKFMKYETYLSPYLGYSGGHRRVPPFVS